ncbi:MAG: UvrD-helicase domain-containing protein [Treponema sp.]|nr:UvrD-helicase domain-containing protein [Treponema sp.]
MAFEYLESLNPEQTEAVTHSGSPLLILAGAGSGKTRVITTKIAYLIQHENVQPWSILAVTFTKKAANEMKERAINLEPLAEQAQIKTFHSFGAWFLRRYAEEAGLDPNFTVYDDDDSASLIMKAVPGMTKKQANLAAHKISLCKDYCLTPDDNLSEFDKDGKLSEIYSAYEQRLRATGNADFGDLIMRPVQIIEKNETIRNQMRYRFRVIMVDEYQDSNVAQFRLLQALSGVKENSGTYVCVVGDDDQSIYKFRGAEVQNILQFPNLFPGTKIIRLERNYRSTGKILAAADAVVSNNTDRLGKTLVAARGEGSLPVLVFLENQDKEAAFCAQLIQKAVETQNAHYSDFAVLYRTNAQSLGLETEFLHKKIPYAVVGSLKFYEREEIKDALGYLSLLVNPRDELAFARIVNKPVRGVGEKSQEKIVSLAYSSVGTLVENLNLLDAAENCAGTLTKKAKEGLKDFCSIMKKFQSELDEKSKDLPDDFQVDLLAEKAVSVGSADSASALKNDEKDFERLSVFIQRVIEESGLDEYHKSQDEIDGTSRVQNLQELVNSAISYPFSRRGLLDFLDSIELDRSLAEQNDESADAVTLITLHNTKGLEFNRVIITGLENGIFPREEKVGDELEEERRLFYVGITRAKNELYITSCAMRRLYGRIQPMMPSRFLLEAGDVFKVMGRIPLSFSNSFGEEKELSPKAELLEKWKKGVRLYNDDYGYGQIVKSDADSGEVVIEVQFENGDRKKFMPEYQGKKLDIIKD